MKYSQYQSLYEGGRGDTTLSTREIAALFSKEQHKSHCSEKNAHLKANLVSMLLK